MPAATIVNTAQPKGASQMQLKVQPSIEQAEATQKKAFRLRGGGCAKDCFIGCIGCFLCFEGCEECCKCIADIICCPCEMCCD